MKKLKWSSKPFEKERAIFLKKQKGCCAICGKNQNLFKHRLNLDHNHKTGQLRGLLCYYCNKFRVGRNTYETSAQVTRYLEVEKGK